MNNYRQVRVLGTGMSGKAILCKNIDTNEDVVVKIIPFSSQDESFQQCFLREVEIFSKLYHPNIVNYYNSFLSQDNLIILMEYCPNGDLYKKINEQKLKKTYFAEEQIKKWVSEILHAISYIHHNHVMHRDIKSSNIFFDSNDNVKLGDFGLSKSLEETNEYANTIAGSPNYLSPEICCGKNYTIKTDIWSLGCVLHELCTLSFTFTGKNLRELAKNIVTTQPSKIPSVYSSQLSDLIEAMLEKDPNNRPSANTLLTFPFFNVIRSISLLSDDTIEYPQEATKNRKVVEKNEHPIQKIDLRKSVIHPPVQQIKDAIRPNKHQTNQKMNGNKIRSSVTVIDGSAIEPKELQKKHPSNSKNIITSRHRSQSPPIQKKRKISSPKKLSINQQKMHQI